MSKVNFDDLSFEERLGDIIETCEKAYARKPFQSLRDLEEHAQFESPIEALLAWAFLSHPYNTEGIAAWIETGRWALGSRASATAAFDDRCRDLSGFQAVGPHTKAILIPQARIERYRVDFLLLAREWYGDPAYSEPRLSIVECDGHAFHERTKKQAARDRARDRALQAKGYPVLRFTGSEIWSNPVGCAEELWRFSHWLTRNQLPPCADTPGVRAVLQ